MSYTTLFDKLVKGKKNKSYLSSYSNVPNQNTAQAKNKLALKGIKGGNCNVTACQKLGATWYNSATNAYYCPYCAHEINRWSRHDNNDLEICTPAEDDRL